MKPFIIFVATVFSVHSLSAQIAVSTNTNSFMATSSSYLPVLGAAPVGNTKYIDLKEGSPFFQDQWSKSKIVMQSGKAYQGVDLRLDLLENKVHYKDSTGKELVISEPIKEIKLQQTGKGEAHFINGEMLPNVKQGWFLLLVNDTLTLLKGFKKTFEEHTSYGSPTEYSIKTNESYIVFIKDKEYEVKKPSDFVNLFPSQKAVIESEIKRNGGKLSKDEQMAKIAVFCNTLLSASH